MSFNPKSVDVIYLQQIENSILREETLFMQDMVRYRYNDTTQISRVIFTPTLAAFFTSVWVA
jgi:hypothetical protein